MHHTRRPSGPVAAAQNCATYGPLSVVSRGGGCTAWSSMRRFGWRLSTRVAKHDRAPPLPPQSRRRVVGPGLPQLLLHPVERRPHRRIVRGDDPPVALEQRFQRHRLGRRQREVEPRTMLVLPVTRPPEADLRPRHIPGEDAVEALRRHMLRQAQRLRRLAVPEARRALPRVVLRLIPLARKIRDRRCRRAKIAQARDHRSPSASGGGSRAARRRAAHG